MNKSDQIKLKAQFLKLQRDNLLLRYERQLKRERFIKRHKKIILSLDMAGWPRLMQMKDRRKWIDLVFKAKIAGVYAIGTANCDVVAQLNRFAKELTD